MSNEDVRTLEPFVSFDAFEDFLFSMLQRDLGSTAGTRAYSLALSGGAFNDYYDDPTRWNAIDAGKLCDYICRQIEKDRAFLAQMAGILSSRR